MDDRNVNEGTWEVDRYEDDFYPWGWLIVVAIVIPVLLVVLL